MATIFGGDGNDLMADALSGGVGSLTLSQGERDIVLAGGGDDTIIGSSISGILPTSYYFGGAGNDSITANQAFGTMLFGEDGDDVLIARILGGNQVLDGGTGNDLIVGAQSATLIGGLGNDTIISGLGADIIFAGDGADSVIGNVLGDTIDAGNGVNTVRGAGGGDVIRGGGQADNLWGEDGNDTIEAGNGANFISGGLDNDLLIGGSANDTINGDEGNDTIHGGNGGTSVPGSFANVLAGGDGDDSITSGFGADSILGGNGNDRIDAGAGNNTIAGGAGLDVIFADNGNDGITGDDAGDTLGGNDFIDAGSGNNTVSGGAGSDIIIATSGNDSLSGDAGNDSISAGGSNDVVLGGAGNDTLSGGTGGDSMQGGDDDDQLLGDTANDTLQGDAGNDIVDGGDGSDTLDGGAGNDRVLGGGSGDLLLASIGNDVADGGEGFDTMDYSTLGANARVVVNIAGGFLRAVKSDATTGALLGTDTISAIETFIGTQNADKFTGADVDETFVGGAGNDTIYGGGGFDTVRYEGANAVTVNLMTGFAQDGLGGTDRLVKIDATNNSIESVVTGDGNDIITGDDDSNFLRGRGGADTLDGGAGSDTADYSGDSTTTAVFANLSAVTVGTVAAGTARDSSGAIDVLISIEGLRGTELADTLIGSDTANNSFRGVRGADIIDGRLGSDLVDYRSDADGAGSLPGSGDFFGVIVNLSAGAVTLPGFGAETNVVVGAQRGRDGWGDIDTLTSIESARGSLFHDLLIGAARIPGFAFGGITHSGSDRSSLRGMLGADTLQATAFTDGVLANYVDDTSGIVARLDLGNTIEDGFGYTDTLVNVFNVQGSAFDDLIAANAGGSFMRGGAGNDTLIGNTGFDALSLGGGSGAVVVNLLAGTATDSEGGADTLLGSWEFISAGSGADSLTGDADGTWFFGGAGADTMVGGAGEDIVSYYSPWVGVISAVHNGVNVNLNAQQGRDGDGTAGGGSLDRYTSIEHALGSHAADTLIGTAGANSLGGAEGDDWLQGAAGNDTLQGGAGADTLDGGNNNDVMDGGTGNDLFLVNSKFDVVNEATGGGADTISGATSYTLLEGSEVEVLELLGAVAFEGVGNSGANRIIGNVAGNRLEGLLGNDTLLGGGGADTLVGGFGADSLLGGADGDIFAFDRLSDSRGGAGTDRIADFTLGIDDLGFENAVGRFSTVALTGINLNAVQTIASAGNASQVYAAITAIAASTATLQVKQVDVLAGAAAGTYLYVNDGNAAVTSGADMLIGLTLVGGATITAGDLILF
jgi:Ca2+-binding RTX toxin-like protein